MTSVPHPRLRVRNSGRKGDLPMKKFAVVLALLMLFCSAFAEEWVAFEEYAAKLAETYGSEWKGEGDIRVLTVKKDVSSVSVCLRGEDVATVTVEAVQDGTLVETALNALGGLGLLSEEILTRVSTMEPGDEITADGFVIGYLTGETRECIYLAAEADYESCMWEPVHGGDQLHAKADCSGMDVPRLITPEAAQQTGYDLCDHCAKSAQEAD